MIYVVSDHHAFFYEDIVELLGDGNCKIVENLSSKDIREDDIVIMTSIYDGVNKKLIRHISKGKTLPCGDSRTILITGSVEDQIVGKVENRIKVYSKRDLFINDLLEYISELQGK